MRLLSYKIINKTDTMDLFYNLMFSKILPNINSGGKIIHDLMPDMNKPKLLTILENLTKQHDKVSWELVVKSKGREYKYSAINGMAKREDVRLD